MTPIPTLDAIADDPACVQGLSPLVCGALVAKTASVLAALSGRLAEAAEAHLPDVGDELLDVHEAARRLGTSARTIWRKRASEPYASLIRSNGTARLRLSAAGIEAYLRGGRPARTPRLRRAT